jgi:hypothetical protein
MASVRSWMPRSRRAGWVASHSPKVRPAVSTAPGGKVAALGQGTQGRADGRCDSHLGHGLDPVERHWVRVTPDDGDGDEVRRPRLAREGLSQPARPVGVDGRGPQRVGDAVHDGVDSLDRGSQPGAGPEVDAGAAARREHLVPALRQRPHHPPAEVSQPARHHDPHRSILPSTVLEGSAEL